MQIKVKKLTPDAKLPEKMSSGAVGFDLFSNEDYIITECETKRISTGIAIELPYGMEGQIRPRSGLATKENIIVINSPGTIDSDYRGEIFVTLYKLPSGKDDINANKFSYLIKNGDRIAQLVINQVLITCLIEAKELTTTKRGSNGYGSTGK